MTSTDPLSEAFVCLVSGHADCTREAIGETGNFLIVHHPALTAKKRNRKLRRLHSDGKRGEVQ